MQSDFEKLQGDMGRVMGTAARDNTETLYGRITELEHELAVREARPKPARYKWEIEDGAFRLMLWIGGAALCITAFAWLLLGGAVAAGGVPLMYALKSFGIFESFLLVLTLLCLAVPFAVGVRRERL